MSDNRRASPRYVVELDAEVRLPAGEAIPLRTRNLSRDGLAGLGASPVATGTVVDLRLALAEGGRAFSQPMRIRARVVWCTPLTETGHQLGMTFLGVTAEQRSYLELFLRYLEEGRSA